MIATRLLEEWLNVGLLRSRYGDHTKALVSADELWYTRAAAKEGKAAADRQLSERDTRERMRDFAAGILPVALGMLDLTYDNPKAAQVVPIDPARRPPFPYCHGIPGVSRMVVLVNPRLPYVLSGPLTDADDFAPGGRLGLKAVTLQAGISSSGAPMAQLNLVLPQRGVDPVDMYVGAFTVVSIDLEGFTRPETFTPRLYGDGPLGYALGLTGSDKAIDWRRGGSTSLDGGVGFPGATNYLADALPRLGAYFTTLAERLAASVQC